MIVAPITPLPRMRIRDWACPSAIRTIARLARESTARSPSGKLVAPRWLTMLPEIGRTSGGGRVALHPSGLVIKVQAYFIDDRSVPRPDWWPARAVPTLVLHGGVIVQPEVDRTNADEICDAIWRLYNYDRREAYGRDTHTGNVGMWRGEPVVFDW